MENLKLLDLNKQEMLEISGGKIPKWTPWGLAIGILYEIKNNWSDIKSGISDAYNDFK